MQSRELLAQCVHATTKADLKEFQSFLQQPSVQISKFIADTIDTLTETLISGEALDDLHLCRKIAFFLLQFYYKVGELDCWDETSGATRKVMALFDADCLLGLSLVSQFFYKEAYNEMLRGMLTGAVSYKIKDWFVQDVRNRLQMTSARFPQSGHEYSLLVVKLVIFLDWEAARSTLQIVSVLEGVLLSWGKFELEDEVKTVVFNLFGKHMRILNEELELKHPAYHAALLKQMKEFVPVKGDDSVEQNALDRLQALFPLLERSTLKAFFVQSGSIEAACVENIMNTDSCLDGSKVTSYGHKFIRSDSEESDKQLLHEKILESLRMSDSENYSEPESDDLDDTRTAATITSANLAILYKYAEKWPEIFESTGRRLDKRVEIERLTRLSREQLEGWWTMLKRNPKKDQLIKKYSLFSATSEKE